MTTQAGFWTAAGAALVLAVAAGLAERRRSRRRNLEDLGWMPWRGIQVTSFFAVLACAILALKA